MSFLSGITTFPNILDNDLLVIVGDHTICCDEKTRARFSRRRKKGKLSRRENEKSHFCAYFVPYDSSVKKVLVGLHKKSGLWLAPGCHIEPNERLADALRRKAKEELSVTRRFDGEKPFLLTTTPISNPGHRCKEHFDIWFRFPIKPELVFPGDEFSETKWVRPSEWANLKTDVANIRASIRMADFFAKILLG